MARRAAGGWLVAAAAVVTGGLAAAVWAGQGGGDAGLHAFLRTTARVAVVFFCLAFAARPAVTVTRGAPWAKRLLANRRYLGVSFALAMGIHLLGIVVLVTRIGAAKIGPIVLGAGGAAYVMIAAMLATSTDRSAAWLGKRWWKRLHATGMVALGAFFLFAYVAGPIFGKIEMLPFSVLVVGAWGLRVGSWTVSRRATSGLPSSQEARP